VSTFPLPTIPCTFLEAIAREEGFYAAGVNRPKRNNNPGDLEWHQWMTVYGSTQGDPRYAIFPTPDMGFAALRHLFGFPLYKGKGAKLQRALIQYFLDYNTDAGYTEYLPPYLVNEASAFATGQLPDKEGQMYHATADNYYLIPTAEVPVTNIYRDTIVKESELPIKMTAYTPCFRREAGSFGKEVRGLNRVHQFDKVEVIQIVAPETSYAVLDEMVLHVEQLLQSLQLPYRILRLCGGDMGFTSAITYDFEVFSAAQERWLEVSSVSNFESYQTNRMKCRYKDASGKTQFTHSLNGSSLALPRIVACLLENNQTPDGILLPEVLHKYFGNNKI
jgi:seryl-tRNA synthetase